MNTKSDASPGRESLFSSHPETRVPIAEYKTQGAPPQPATCVEYRLLIQKNRRKPFVVSSCKKSYDFLRRHYPHQVKGSKVHPSSQPVNTSSPVFQLSKQKPETPVLMPPVEKLRTMTSYGGITRIRLKGRSWITSSQPACTSSPVFVCKSIIYPLLDNCKWFLV